YCARRVGLKTSAISIGGYHRVIRGFYSTLADSNGLDGEGCCVSRPKARPEAHNQCLCLAWGPQPFRTPSRQNLPVLLIICVCVCVYVFLLDIRLPNTGGGERVAKQRLSMVMASAPAWGIPSGVHWHTRRSVASAGPVWLASRGPVECCTGTLAAATRYEYWHGGRPRTVQHCASTAQRCMHMLTWALQHGSMAGRTFVLRTGMTNTGRGKRMSTWASLSDAVDVDVGIDRPKRLSNPIPVSSAALFGYSVHVSTVLYPLMEWMDIRVEHQLAKFSRLMEPTDRISPLISPPNRFQMSSSWSGSIYSHPAQGPLNFAAAHEPCQSCQARGCTNGKGSAVVPRTESGVHVRSAALSSTTWRSEHARRGQQS
ncbi:hypothetical protein CFAM422_009472, partial [Trichoderma lentiforme]